MLKLLLIMGVLPDELKTAFLNGNPKDKPAVTFKEIPDPN
jgi:hypothetical protein